MKLLIIDDHAVLLDALGAMLARLIPGAEVETAGDGAAGLELAGRRGDLDVVLLDLLLPGAKGTDVVSAFRASHPALPIIVLSSSADPGDVRRAMAAGAQGYVSKSASPHTLVSAIRIVLAGDLYVPPFMLSDDARVPAPSALGLTSRQGDVLRLLAGGASNKEIGQALRLSEKTVKVHVAAIFRTLGVTKRMQAADRARQAGLV